MDEVICRCGASFPGMPELHRHVEELAAAQDEDLGHGFLRLAGKLYDPPDDD